jgi:hypothetical protein
MVTRKDLLGYRLDEAVKRARLGTLPQQPGAPPLFESPRGGGTPRGSLLLPSDATPDRF